MVESTKKSDNTYKHEVLKGNDLVKKIESITFHKYYKDTDKDKKYTFDKSGKILDKHGKTWGSHKVSDDIVHITNANKGKTKQYKA